MKKKEGEGNHNQFINNQVVMKMKPPPLYIEKGQKNQRNFLQDNNE